MNKINQSEHQEFEESYQYIRKDLKHVLLINGVILALLIALYFINQETGFLNGLENLV